MTFITYKYKLYFYIEDSGHASIYPYGDTTGLRHIFTNHIVTLRY